MAERDQVNCLYIVVWLLNDCCKLEHFNLSGKTRYYFHCAAPTGVFWFDVRILQDGYFLSSSCPLAASG